MSRSNLHEFTRLRKNLSNKNQVSIPKRVDSKRGFVLDSGDDVIVSMPQGVDAKPNMLVLVVVP